MLFRGRGNDTSRVVDDERTCSSGTYVDSQERRYRRLARRREQAPLQTDENGTVYVNDRYTTMSRGLQVKA